MLILSSVFAGTAVAESGASSHGGEARAEQQAGFPASFICKNIFTNQLQLAFFPSCSPGQMLIDVQNSLPFDYCYSAYTLQMFDDLPSDQCNFGQQYVVVDGLSSFFVCAHPFTRALSHAHSVDGCGAGFLVFFIDLRGDIDKHVCIEENLNDNLCDVIPGGGPQNEIRQLEPLIITPFIDNRFRLEFRGDQTNTMSAATTVNLTAAGIQAELQALPSIGIGNVIVTELDPGELWAYGVGGDPATATPLRVEFTGALGNQDITDPILLINVQSANGAEENTVIDGAAAGSPGLNNVMPGGTVQIFQATGATDPNNPATYGSEVTAGPQPVDASGVVSFVDLFEGDYVVCADGTGSVRPNCEIVTINANTLSLVNNVDLPGMITAAITDTAGGNEIQSYDDIPFGGLAVTGGTYTFSFMGVGPSNVLQFNANAASVQSALESLANINVGDVIVTGGPPNLFGPPIVVEFTGQYAGVDVPQLVVNSSLTGTGGQPRNWFFDPNFTDRDGFATVQTLTADARVSGGTFTLSYNNGTTNSTTGPLAFNASVSTIEAALNLLPSITAGGGSVQLFSTDPNPIPGSEPITKAPVEVQFVNVTNSDTNVLVVDNTLLE